MKRLAALLLAFMLICASAACGKTINAPTAEDANTYLTEFFSSYNEMNTYLKNPEIGISLFALDGAGLSSLLRAAYQAHSITFAFSEPIQISENIFNAQVEVTAPDIEPLYAMYVIDRQLAVEDIPEDFVAQAFYDNIRGGTTTTVTTTVSVTINYHSGKWSLSPSNDLAFAMFPNIDKTEILFEEVTTL